MTIKLRDGKITCDKHMMNYLSIVFSEAANHYESIGLNALARTARENSDLIFEALDACHYYDNVEV